MSWELFELNSVLDAHAFAATFARDRRVQVRDFLTEHSAHELRDVLERATPWGTAWHAGDDGPHAIRRDALRALAPADRQALAVAVNRAAGGPDYAFRFGQYPLVQGYVEKWDPQGPHDRLLEFLNGDAFLGLMRTITGISEILKADGQATLFAAGDFLAVHNDSHVTEGRRVAYVLNLADPGWRPDWGGYLNFLDEDGDIVAGWRPRFNTLNLFLVPQLHNVSYVPPFAPAHRFAITGWLRDR